VMRAEAHFQCHRLLMRSRPEKPTESMAAGVWVVIIWSTSKTSDRRDRNSGFRPHQRRSAESSINGIRVGTPSFGTARYVLPVRVFSCFKYARPRRAGPFDSLTVYEEISFQSRSRKVLRDVSPHLRVRMPLQYSPVLKRLHT
jgi:hypothetical protein